MGSSCKKLVTARALTIFRKGKWKRRWAVYHAGERLLSLYRSALDWTEGDADACRGHDTVQHAVPAPLDGFEWLLVSSSHRPPTDLSQRPPTDLPTPFHQVPRPSPEHPFGFACYTPDGSVWELSATDQDELREWLQALPLFQPGGEARGAAGAAIELRASTARYREITARRSPRAHAGGALLGEGSSEDLEEPSAARSLQSVKAELAALKVLQPALDATLMMMMMMVVVVVMMMMIIIIQAALDAPARVQVACPPLRPCLALASTLPRPLSLLDDPREGRGCAVCSSAGAHGGQGGARVDAGVYDRLHP